MDLQEKNIETVCVCVADPVGGVMEGGVTAALFLVIVLGGVVAALVCRYKRHKV